MNRSTLARSPHSSASVSSFSMQVSRHLRRALPLALGVFSLVMVNPALAQEEHMSRTLTVTGQGSESIPTTLSQVTLGVEVQGETAEAVQAEAARRSSAVVELLRSRNVTKLQTAGLFLNPTYDYSNNSPKITGYTATNTVSFRVPTEQAGALMDDVIRAGATRIDGITFVADDTAIATAQQQAIREATQNARSQANAAFEALGLTPGDVVSVQVNGSNPPPPMPMYGGALARASADAAPTPVIGGEQEVQASVTLEISY